jgi:hypothetical protein
MTTNGRPRALPGAARGGGGIRPRKPGVPTGGPLPSRVATVLAGAVLLLGMVTAYVPSFGCA